VSLVPPDTAVDVRLRPWSTEDEPLLERLLGDPAMTVYLGGPESTVKLRRLHHDYLALRPPMGRMFAIVAGEDAAAVGSVGYWLADRGSERYWELGCSVLPEFQGRGYGTRALVLAPAIAREDAPGRPIHAFPAVENVASNAMCRRAGFALAGETEVDVRPGRSMRVNDWVLAAPRREAAAADRERP
jgi:RimJ/RimL family protein N-acetyltransferase